MESPNIATTRGAGGASSCSTITSESVVVALEMKNLLREMKDEHIIVFSTHILQLATDLCDEIVLLTGGELEPVDASIIHSREFEDRVVELLKEEGHD